MTLRALRKRNLANHVHWVKDGEEALEYLFCSGRYAGRDRTQPPRAGAARPQDAEGRRHRGAAPGQGLRAEARCRWW